MGNSKKRRSGATPEEMLQLIAKAEEQIAKKTQEEIESENNNTGNNYVTNCNKGKNISSSAVQIKFKDKTQSKTKDKTEEKAYAKPIKKAKEKSSINVKRGATPEEILQMIAQAEEKIAKEGREELSFENIITSKTEQVHTTEIKDLLSFESPPEGTEKTPVRTCEYLPGPKYIKTKVAIFIVLATLSATALTFGLSMVNFPSEIFRDVLTIKKKAQIVTIDFAANENDTGIGNETGMNHDTLKLSPAQTQEATLSVVKGYNQSNKNISSTKSDIKLVESSDNNRWEVSFDSYTSFDFSDISIPTDAQIKSVVVFIEHFEEKQFVQGKLEWSIGAGWPSNPVVWASIKAPVKKGVLDEAVDSWDITSLVDSSEKINSLQLHVENNNTVADSKTLINYINVLVRWD